MDLIDRCKVTTFFRKCGKCRARSGAENAKQQTPRPEGQSAHSPT